MIRLNYSTATLSIKLKRYRVPESRGKVVFMSDWKEQRCEYKIVPQSDKLKQLLYSYFESFIAANCMDISRPRHVLLYFRDR